MMTLGNKVTMGVAFLCTVVSPSSFGFGCRLCYEIGDALNLISSASAAFKLSGASSVNKNYAPPDHSLDCDTINIKIKSKQGCVHTFNF